MANHDLMFTTDGKPLEVPPDVFAPDLLEAAKAALGILEDHIPAGYWRDLIRDLLSTAVAKATGEQL